MPEPSKNSLSTLQERSKNAPLRLHQKFAHLQYESIDELCTSRQYSVRTQHHINQTNNFLLFSTKRFNQQKNTDNVVHLHLELRRNDLGRGRRCREGQVRLRGSSEYDDIRSSREAQRSHGKSETYAGRNQV
jgi:hypothetical protein